mgnify:CR=1 FL=1
MKIGDLVRVKEEHWAEPGEVGIIVAELFPDSKTNRRKAFRILFAGGRLRPKLSKQLEVVNEM